MLLFLLSLLLFLLMQNILTGEHSCIMLKSINKEEEEKEDGGDDNHTRNESKEAWLSELFQGCFYCTISLCTYLFYDK